MRELWLISAFLLCNLLFAENNDVELIRYNSIDISLMDTSELDPKLKHFLASFVFTALVWAFYFDSYV